MVTLYLSIIRNLYHFYSVIILNICKSIRYLTSIGAYRANLLFLPIPFTNHIHDTPIACLTKMSLNVIDYAYILIKTIKFDLHAPTAVFKNRKKYS